MTRRARRRRRRRAAPKPRAGGWPAAGGDRGRRAERSSAAAAAAVRVEDAVEVGRHGAGPYRRPVRTPPVRARRRAGRRTAPPGTTARRARNAHERRAMAAVDASATTSDARRHRRREQRHRRAGPASRGERHDSVRSAVVEVVGEVVRRRPRSSAGRPGRASAPSASPPRARSYAAAAGVAERGPRLVDRPHRAGSPPAVGVVAPGQRDVGPPDLGGVGVRATRRAPRSGSPASHPVVVGRRRCRRPRRRGRRPRRRVDARRAASPGRLERWSASAMAGGGRAGRR